MCCAILPQVFTLFSRSQTKLSQRDKRVKSSPRMAKHSYLSRPCFKSVPLNEMCPASELLKTSLAQDARVVPGEHRRFTGCALAISSFPDPLPVGTAGHPEVCVCT